MIEEMVKDRAGVKARVTEAYEKAKALQGVTPYFYREYDQAVRNYPVPRAIGVISLLCDYDYLAKGGNGETMEPGEMLVELTTKILNI